MAKPVEGLKSEALLAALEEALAGRSLKLEELLARHGGLPSPKPNVRLAAAFGAEVGSRAGELAPLLTRLASDTAAPDDPRAFLPIAAAHGFTHRIREGREVDAGFRALEELAADERAPVRVGVLDAVVTLGMREGGADLLVARASEWLETEDRELCFGAAALVVEALGDVRVLAVLRDQEALLAYLTRAIDKVAGAARAAERSDGRRRLLMSLSSALAAVVAVVRAGDRGLLWFEAECERAKHPDVRASLSQALLRLAKLPQAPAVSLVDGLRQKLEGSAKPLRDPTLVRPGTGRGRRSRNTR